MSDIKSTNWDGTLCVLVYEKTGARVQLEDRVPLSGRDWTVKGGRAPHKPSSTGQVWVQRNSVQTSYYPGVIGARWIREETA